MGPSSLALRYALKRALMSAIGAILIERSLSTDKQLISFFLADSQNMNLVQFTKNFIENPKAVLRPKTKFHFASNIIGRLRVFGSVFHLRPCQLVLDLSLIKG
jgi:hypothetical protein